MNKIVNYLNEHLQGEVLASPHVRERYASDGGVISIQPEMVAFARTTNDIRKIMRFAWQLAEKGHSIPVTVRGNGTSGQGAAIGKGIVIDTAKHLRDVLELDVKQKLARVQPGITTSALNDGFRFHSLALPTVGAEADGSTIGGAIAVNARSEYSGKYGATGDYVEQLEVVLASGEVLQTGRLSRKEVARKLGLQTFEGEIYRNIDTLLSENDELIRSMSESYCLGGYPGIINVRRKDGSLDLTPLFVGSEGTLGIISEVIMRADYVSPHTTSVLGIFKSAEDARDAMDEALGAKAAAVEYFSADILKQALLQGKRFDWMSAELLKTGAIVLVEFDDYHEKLRLKLAKRLAKRWQSLQREMLVIEEDDDTRANLSAVRSVLALAQHPTVDRAVVPRLFTGIMVPLEKMDTFIKALAAISKKHGLAFPLHIRALDSMFSVYPTFDFSKVTDRQKIFTVMEEFATVVAKLGGTMYAGAPEGRLRTTILPHEVAQDANDLYVKIKKIFDPYDILNPGVKQPNDAKELLRHIDARPDIHV